MKTVFLASLLIFATSFARAADTAYGALRVVGNKNGSDSLNRVMDVRGRSGTPVPAVWKITFDEPKARGGIREVEVQHGKIISERTPTGKSQGSAMNFNQLNLDSEGAFTIANQQAEKAGIPFDHVDYLLKSGTSGGAPVWELQLFNGREGAVATVQIAADSGTVLRKEGFTARLAPEPRVDQRPRPVEDRDFVRNAPEERPEEPRRYDTRPHEPIRDFPSLVRRTGQHFERRGHQIKRFLTGND